MKLGCWGILIGLALVGGGGQGVYENWVSGKRTEVAFDRFRTDLPGSGWYKIKDGQWQLADAVLIQNQLTNSTTGDLYAPVKPMGEDEPGAVQDKSKKEDVQPDPAGTDEDKSGAYKVLIHTSDGALAAKLEKLVNAKTDAEAAKLLIDDEDYLKPRPVAGMLEFGINSDNADNKAVTSALGDKLASDYVVIADGKEPEGYGLNLVLLAIGLLILGVAVVAASRSANAPDPVDE